MKFNSLFICLIGIAAGLVTGNLFSSAARTYFTPEISTKASAPHESGGKQSDRAANGEPSPWSDAPFTEGALRAAAVSYRSAYGFAEGATRIATILAAAPNARCESLAEAAVTGLFSNGSTPREEEIIACVNTVPWLLGSRIAKRYIATQPMISIDGTYRYAYSILSRAIPVPDSVVLEQAATQAAYEQWAPSHPKEALNFLRGRLSPAEVTACINRSIAKLFVRCQDSAVALLAQMGNEDPSTAAAIVADSLMPVKNILLLSNELTGAAQYQFISRYVELVAKEDPKTIITLTSVLKPSSLSSSALTASLHAMARVDPTKIEAWIGDLSPDDKASALAQVVPFLADAVGGRTIAALYINSIANGAKLDRFSLIHCIWSLRGEDVERSLRLVAGLPGEDQENIRRMLLLNKASTLDPADPAGLKQLLSVSPPEAKAEILSRAFAQWSEEDYTTALAAVDAVPEPELRKLATVTVLKNSKCRIPLEERERITFELIHTNQFNSELLPAVDKLIEEAAATDIDTAVSYINRIPAGEAREAVSAAFVRQWAALDAVSTANWIKEHPEGRLRDVLSAQLVACVRDEPKTALAWASSIRDPKLRIDAAREVVNAWGPENAIEMRQAFEAAKFPADEIEGILAPAQ